MLGLRGARGNALGNARLGCAAALRKNAGSDPTIIPGMTTDPNPQATAEHLQQIASELAELRNELGAIITALQGIDKSLEELPAIRKSLRFG